MSNAWGGFANGDIPESAMRKVAGDNFCRNGGSRCLGRDFGKRCFS